MSKPKIDIPSENAQNEEPVYLKNDPLYFAKERHFKSRAFVPPPTPNRDIECTRTKEIPEIHVTKIEDVPTVKEEGIKSTIESLGKQLGLGNYEYDLIQFWLLDMLTDCVWKAQEVSQFDAKEQKVVLNWITAIFKIIADPILNISRKNFLKLFKDVLLESYRKISMKFQFPGTELLEEVSKKYVIQEEVETAKGDGENVDGEEVETESSSSSSNESLSTLSVKNMDHMVIYPEFDIKEHIERLKKNNPLSNTYHCYSETNSHSTKLDESIDEEGTDIANDYLDLPDQDVSFYKPDIETPTRFRCSLEFEDISQPTDICKCIIPEDSSESICTIPKVKSYKEVSKPSRDSLTKQAKTDTQMVEEEELTTTHTKSGSVLMQENLSAYVKNMTASSQILNYLSKGKYEQMYIKPCMKGVRPVEVFTISEPDDAEESMLTEEELEKIREREIMNEWAYFLTMEQRGWDMDDPNVGWVPWLSFLEKEKGSVEQFVMNEDEVRSSRRKTSFEEFDLDRARNFKILKAIVDFVFEYFYENFHFTLIKLAFRSTPSTITQEINTKWPTPKVMKQEFKRPKPAKKPKKKKEKKAKSKSKSSKKSKKVKSDKKSKGSKKGKKGQKEKKEKPKIDKEELARLRQLAEAEEEERIKREENRVFMFPLADAASESLFMSIFENWVKKAAEDEKGKKDKKGKKGKKEKKGGKGKKKK